LLEFISTAELHLIGILLIAVGFGGAFLSALRLIDASITGRETRSKAKGSTTVARRLGKEKSEKRRVSRILFFLAIAFAGAFLYSYDELTVSATTVATASPLPDYRVLETKTEVFSKQFSPVECEGLGGFVYLRELRVYEATRVDEQGGNKSVFLSTFTFTIKNNGSNSASNVVLTEHVPDVVATDPAYVFNYSIPPASARKGSVVVDWLFDNVDSGEEKTISYTVEKKVDAGALNDFPAPNVVSRTVKQGAVGVPKEVLKGEVTEVAEQKAGTDWSAPGLAIIATFAAALTYFFVRRNKNELQA